MPDQILGIHHVTAIASDPQTNLDFYAGILGLRLVKRTVNFDDPGTYHFYYGDATGQPGTILSFFPWQGAVRGHQGTGQVTITSFSIPPNSLPYWIARLREYGVNFEGTTRRLDEEVLTVYDLDGLQLELVAHAGASAVHVWPEGPVPAEHALRGLHSVTLAEAGGEATLRLLTEIMGFAILSEEDDRVRCQIEGAGPGHLIDVICLPGEQPGRISAGSVHHVAWRVADGDAQTKWRVQIAQAGLGVTPVRDREYFRSIYFHEPGGVLFEIATDTPGFTRDEPAAALGTQLMLPAWLEESRAELEQHLTPVHVP
jgi:catechol 2,3-dioxygenase-like lactoylglutathione lyase family enzyme